MRWSDGSSYRNEPTAAALAYGLDKAGKDEKIAVLTWVAVRLTSPSWNWEMACLK